MLNEETHDWSAGSSFRCGAILAVTLVGAVWLYWKGPVPVVRGTTPLQETAPFWYMVSAFPILGMLVADLVYLFRHYGFERRSFELASQLAVLLVVSNARLGSRLPISGHILLFAYFILRRLLIRIPAHKLARAESLIATFLFAVTAYVKITWWSDPITVAFAAAMALGLVAISWFVLKGESARFEVEKE